MKLARQTTALFVLCVACGCTMLGSHRHATWVLYDRKAVRSLDPAQEKAFVAASRSILGGKLWFEYIAESDVLGEGGRTNVGAWVYAEPERVSGRLFRGKCCWLTGTEVDAGTVGSWKRQDFWHVAPKGWDGRGVPPIDDFYFPFEVVGACSPDDVVTVVDAVRALPGKGAGGVLKVESKVEHIEVMTSESRAFSQRGGLALEYVRTNGTYRLTNIGYWN